MNDYGMNADKMARLVLAARVREYQKASKLQREEIKRVARLEKRMAGLTK